VYYKLQRREMVERIVTDRDIADAVEIHRRHPARLRGRVHQEGQGRKRDYTVDWST